MAATTSLVAEGILKGGGTGVRWERHTITYDSDATVEVNTKFMEIHSMTAFLVGAGGDANSLSIQAQPAATGLIDVDAVASNSGTYLMTITGL